MFSTLIRFLIEVEKLRRCTALAHTNVHTYVHHKAASKLGFVTVTRIRDRDKMLTRVHIDSLNLT